MITVYEVTPQGIRTYNVTRQALTRIKQEALNQEFPAESVTRSLHFPTKLMEGNTHVHIVNHATYRVELEKRFVYPGEALCGRRSMFHRSDEVHDVEPTCPGCVAIAQGLSARDAR